MQLSELVKRYETVLKDRNTEIKEKNKQISELQSEVGIEDFSEEQMAKMKKECARLKEQSRRLEALCRYLQVFACFLVSSDRRNKTRILIPCCSLFVCCTLNVSTFKQVFKMILLFLILLCSVTLARDSCAINNPVPCGFEGVLSVFRVFLGISSEMCVDRGCCFKEGTSPSCFYPNMGMAEITKVHIIHGCHFDAGFVDTTVNIVNRYFDEIYPRIYSVCVFRLKSKYRKGRNMRKRDRMCR